MSFDWSKQTEASLKIFKKFQNNFDWSKNRLDQSKQTEASLNNFKTISIDRKTDWINRNRQRLTKFWGKTQFLKKKNLETSQSIEIDEQNA